MAHTSIDTLHDHQCNDDSAAMQSQLAAADAVGTSSDIGPARPLIDDGTSIADQHTLPFAVSGDVGVVDSRRRTFRLPMLRLGTSIRRNGSPAAEPERARNALGIGGGGGVGDGG